MKNEISQLTTHSIARLFGFTQKEKEVYVRTIRNQNGMELTVSDLGATITSLKVPMSEYSTIDVVLGFENAEDYEASFSLPSPPFLGCAVGPFAGRINKGRFTLNGAVIQLDSNLGMHHIHGGNRNLSNQVWRFKSATLDDNPSLTYTITTLENQGNYPGATTVMVTYQLLENNALKVTFHATATQDTLVNLTQHSYFNLNGHNQSVKGMQLKLFAATYLDTDYELIPSGKFIPVKDSIHDYSSVSECPQSIDTTFVINQPLAATLFSPKNKLRMDVFTNQPAVHVYVGGNCFNQIKGKEQADYHPLSGICFETQNYPDAPNHAHFPNAFLKKGEAYLQETLFQFKKTESL
ncbi:MAG: Aldose 1-epimerase [Bacteroidota bacterium]|jgi:aldose 1-epimerase